MAEEEVQGTEEEGKGVAVADVKGSDSLAIKEAHTPAADPNAVTPETFGVSQAQFDKFYNSKENAYNWEAHAKELAWQMSQKGEQPAEAKEPEVSKVLEGTAPEDVTEAQAKAAVKEAGLDWDAMSAEIVESGNVTKESRQALNEKGIPDEVIDTYVNGIAKAADDFKSSVMEELGGEQGIAFLKDWALKNLTPEEIRLYEKKLSDPAEYQVYAESLKTRSGFKEGDPSQLVKGPNAQGTSKKLAPYSDMSELLKDQRNPKYKKDPEFRAQVMTRARASTFNVNPRGHVVG